MADTRPLPSKATRVELEAVGASQALNAFDLSDGDEIKEGILSSFSQPMAGGGGRRFKDVRLTLVRINRPEDPEFHYVLSFKVRADRWCSIGLNRGIDIDVRRGAGQLEKIFDGRIIEMQDPGVWYDVSRTGAIESLTFASSDNFLFTANADSVVPC